jgi:hypothetical protein
MDPAAVDAKTLPTWRTCMKRGLIHVALIALSLFHNPLSLFPASLKRHSQGQAQPLVLTGGTIIDTDNFGRTQLDVRDSIVVIEGDQITAAGLRDKIKIPSGAKTIDISGKFVIPGLNDAFAAQNNQAHANAYLYMGVTSIVGIDDPGGRRGPLFLRADPKPARLQVGVRLRL